MSVNALISHPTGDTNRYARQTKDGECAWHVYSYVHMQRLDNMRNQQRSYFTADVRLVGNKWRVNLKNAAYGQDRQDITSTRFNTPERKEALATLINLNGRLCARVVGLSGTESRPVVECIESRNATTRVTYVIDMDSGRVLR